MDKQASKVSWCSIDRESSRFVVIIQGSQEFHARQLSVGRGEAGGPLPLDKDLASVPPVSVVASSPLAHPIQSSDWLRAICMVCPLF